MAWYSKYSSSTSNTSTTPNSGGQTSWLSKYAIPTPSPTPSPTSTPSGISPKSIINNPQSPYYQAPQSGFLQQAGNFLGNLGQQYLKYNQQVFQGATPVVSKALQKVPELNLGTKGKDIVKATETETKIIDFLSNMPTAFANSYGKTLERLGTPGGQKELAGGAKNLPTTVTEVKSALSNKEWGKAFQLALDNPAVAVALDVSDFIPISLLTKAGLKGLTGSRKTAQQIVKTELKKSGVEDVAKVFEPVKVPEVAKAETKPLQPLAEEARTHVEAGLRRLNAGYTEPLGTSNKLVTVYRGVDTKFDQGLVHGQYVTTDKARAAQYGNKVVELKVPENQLHVADPEGVKVGLHTKTDLIYNNPSSPLEGAKVAEEARGMPALNPKRVKWFNEKKTSEPIAKKALEEMKNMERKYQGKKNLTLTNAEKVSLEKQYKELSTIVRTHLDTYGGFDSGAGWIEGKGEGPPGILDPIIPSSPLEGGGGIKVYSGHDTQKGSRYFTSNKDYATLYGKNIREVNLLPEEIFDIRNPQHKKIFGEIRSRLKTNNEIDPRTGLIKSQGDAKEVENALKQAGYNFKAIAFSENTGIGDDISYFVAKSKLSPPGLEGGGGIKVYRGISENKGTGFAAYGKGTYLTDTEDIAKSYAGKSGKIEQFNLSNSNLLDAEKYKIEGDIKNFFVEQYKSRGFSNFEAGKKIDDLLQYARTKKDNIYNFRGELEYISKQVGLTDDTTEQLASIIKKQGFDGVKYLSAPEIEGFKGTNYVLYNDKTLTKPLSGLEGGGGGKYYHVTSTDVAPIIQQQGFKAQVGERSLGATKGKGVFLYESFDPTEEFGKNFLRAGKTPTVLETRVNGKIFDATAEDYPSIRGLAEDTKLINKLRAEGYVGIRGDEMGTPVTFIFEPKAIKPSPSGLEGGGGKVEPKVEPIGEGVTKASKLGLRVEQTAIEKKLTDELTDLPEYKQLDMKDQAKKASDLLNTDPDKAMRIALGEELPPEGLLKESVFKALEGSITTPEMAAKLANSPLVSEATALGQKIKALDVKVSDSPVEAIKEVIDTRAKQLEKKLGKNVDQATKDTVKEIKSKVKTPDKYDWGAFLEEIKCK